MNPRRIFVLVFMLLCLMGNDAAADEVKPLPDGHVHLESGSGQLIGPDGQRYFLPVGSHILDGTSWENIDGEYRRLQDQETRLRAENRSLKDSLKGWRPGWITITSVLLVGVAAGVGGYYWYEHR